MTPLAGRVAVVTGASTGIGNATARALAAEGALVVLAARNEDRIATLETDIKADGGTAVAVPTDVTDDAHVQRLVHRTVDTYGGIDILVNNAGVANWDNEGIAEADFEEWRREIEVNLLGLMAVTRCAVPEMQEGADLVNISSGADRVFSGEWPSYVTSKWGVRGFTGSARLALRDRGIRTTLLSPGEVDTPIQPEGFAEERLAENVRILDPEDVAESVIFVVTRPPHVSVPTLYISPSGRRISETD